ncbi:sigma-E factor regulatory protein RseB domain-containing protein [Natronorubrum halophilum]|uniref:sigma-E factor regulatory protein RseB domain-containing protein n=1 Tax=Natronorubrum halophilum TaxID=1702106 RepID=UPI000EF6BEE8|nr:sigma-E factor regulatory protein RseB domain-containing protein [Natronorubrum halophilum]
MTIRRFTAVVAVSLLLVTAGCLGAVSFDDGDADPDEDADDELPATNELPDADELLEQTMEAESSIDDVHGVQTVTVDDGDDVVTSTHEVWQRSSGEYRSELLETDDSEEFDVTVSNGTTTWMYDEADNEAVRTDLEFDAEELEALSEEMADSLYANMTATVDGTATVADRKAYVLELTPDGDDAIYESVTLWIDQESKYPLKQESTMTATGNVTVTIAFEEVTFNEGIDDERFAFEPPADAEIIDTNDFAFEQFDDIGPAADATPFELPDPDVPAEYALEGVTVSEGLNGWSASLQYADDAETFLFVSVTNGETDSVVDPDGTPVEIGETDAIVREFGPETTAIEWNDGGLSYTVSGDLETDELTAIAESIVD